MILKSFKYYQHWNDCKFQIHWNNLELVFPKILNVNKTPFCTSYHNFLIIDRNPTNHWIGLSRIKPIDVDDLFNIRFIMSELEASFNDNDTFNSSGITEGQTEAEVVEEVLQK